ncbi:hypothetical protein K0B90_01865 [bacterium]|nr:hypothetical protein [bacterium]
MKTEAAKCRRAMIPRIAMMVAPARMMFRSCPALPPSVVPGTGWVVGDAASGDSPDRGGSMSAGSTIALLYRFSDASHTPV